MPDDIERDEVLISRLKALGYSIALPEGAGVGERSDQEEDRTAAGVRSQASHGQPGSRATLLDRLLASTRNGPKSVEKVRSPSPAVGQAPSPLRPPDDSLSGLLQLVDEHKEGAVAAKQAKAQQKRASRSLAAGIPLSPTKRARRRSPSVPTCLSSSPSASGSESDSPGPTTPCPPKRPPRPAFYEKDPVSSASRKPTLGSAKVVSMAALAIVTPRSFAATPLSPFALAAGQIGELLPDASFVDILQLGRALEQNRALLSLAQQQADSSGRRFGSNLSFLGSHVFSGSPLSPSDPGHAALRLAKALRLDLPDNSTSSATNDSALPVLTTPFATCVQCCSALTLRRRPTEPVWLVRPAQPAEQVLVAIHTCTNPTCSAVHTPDHVGIGLRGKAAWLWHEQAIAIKVGERVWITKEGAEHVRSLVMEQAVSPGGFATMWNRLYAQQGDESSPSDNGDESDIDDEDCSGALPDRSPRKPVGAESSTRKRPRGSPFRLRAAHVWRAFVIATCLHEGRRASSGRFATICRPSTRTLVDFANTWLFPHVLSEHTCSTCTRPRQRWLGGPATAAERRGGVQWAGTRVYQDLALVEDVETIEGPPVQMAICDGIAMGYSLCASPDCDNSPQQDRRSARFCADHLYLHERCGVVGCDLTRTTCDSALGSSEACDKPRHQELWQAFLRRSNVRQDRGRRRGAYERQQPVVEESSSADDSGDGATEPDSEYDDINNSAPRRKVETMWAMRRTSNLQLLVAACGAPLAWTSFVDGEHVVAVLEFLNAVHDDYAAQSLAMPSYIAYDRACQVLRQVLDDIVDDDEPSLPPLLARTRLTVDAFHHRCHGRDDLLCDNFCHLAPLDGSAPDLVIPLRTDGTSSSRRQQDRRRKAAAGATAERKGGRVFERAFNTAAAEQLNSHLSRFSVLLGGMRASNFDFLMHALLRNRRELLQSP